MGRLLRKEDLVPDIIISSTARRALATAKAVAEESGYPGEIQLEEQLYAAGPEAYLAVLSNLPDEHASALIVGHNPGLEELLEAVTGEAESLPTAALAQVRLPIRRWRELTEGSGKLVNLWLPRSLQ